MLLQKAGTSLATKSVAEGDWVLFGDISVANPWLGLFFLVLLIPLFFWGRTAKGREAGRIVSLPAQLLPRSLRQRLAWLGTTLHFSALVLLALGLARPLRGKVESSSVTEGVDIALLIDRSSSMQHQDLARGRTRLEVVKEVVGAFAERRMTDREGAADSISLITFARYPQLLCPFTLDVAAVTGFLESVSLAQIREEDGTGIGIALAKAVAVLKETEAKSKVVVLLTDGENNIDLISPMDAAELATEEEVRVYTVLAGRYLFMSDEFGRPVATEQEIDSTDLEAIADLTGGLFFRAKDKASLAKVYEAIEELERTEREEQSFSEQFDLYPYLLLASFLAYMAAWLFSSTWARRLP